MEIEEGIEPKVQIGLYVPYSIHKKWKASEMKASKVFEYGLEVRETREKNKFLQENNEKLLNMRQILEKRIQDLNDEITILKSKIEEYQGKIPMVQIRAEYERYRNMIIERGEQP